MNTSARIHLQVFGRVQGVGYRINCYRQARSLGLTGWVRNLPDDSVEIVAEGSVAALKVFSAWCRKGPAFADVEHVTETPEPASGEFRLFEIKKKLLTSPEGNANLPIRRLIWLFLIQVNFSFFWSLLSYV